MMPTPEDTVNLFESQTDGNKAIILGRVAYDLTIAARCVYTEGTPEQQRQKLVAISEIQHNALSQMLAYLQGHKDRYSDEDIVLILVDRAKKSGLWGHMQLALQKALSGFGHGRSEESVGS